MTMKKLEFYYQSLFDGGIVVDDSIVDDQECVLRIGRLRMSVHSGRRSVSSPSCMSNTTMCGKKVL